MPDFLLLRAWKPVLQHNQSIVNHWITIVLGVDQLSVWHGQLR
jgi:hypothetical protein